ncbi:hypothetical protein HDU97_008116 [Phlyctochytrium planicorne]|nr:hypothetical protein HDU97_008116 [Phlyctochytrium planicorne]
MAFSADAVVAKSALSFLNTVNLSLVNASVVILHLFYYVKNWMVLDQDGVLTGVDMLHNCMDNLCVKVLLSLLNDSFANWAYLAQDQKAFFQDCLEQKAIPKLWVRNFGYQHLLQNFHIENVPQPEIVELLQTIALDDSENQARFVEDGGIPELIFVLKSRPDQSTIYEALVILSQLLDNSKVNVQVAEQILKSIESIWKHLPRHSEIRIILLMIDIIGRINALLGDFVAAYNVLEGIKEIYGNNETVAAELLKILSSGDTAVKKEDKKPFALEVPVILESNEHIRPSPTSVTLQELSEIASIYKFIPQVKPVKNDDWLEPIFEMLRSENIFSRSEAMLSLRNIAAHKDMAMDDVRRICKEIMPCFEEEEVTLI